MNFKQKIIAACLAAVIAGAGIFQTNIAQATPGSLPNDTLIANMLQMIETLKQQIQQIIALIAQLKPLETCGNGYCRFGETAASCPADCPQPTYNNHTDNNSTDNSSTENCVSRNCGDMDRDCGIWADGCGAKVNCGDCTAGFVCKSGECLADSSVCANECASSGAKQCSDNGVQTCGNYDNDNCLEWSTLTNCLSGQTCANATCMANCTPNCAGKACGSDGCNGSCGTCPSGQNCNSENTCVASCANECASSGAKQCSGNGVQTCGNYDTDTCLEWSTIAACGANQTCQNGNCTQLCQPNYTKKCYNGDVYWYDSCNVRGSIYDDCTSQESCTAQGTCSSAIVVKKSNGAACTNNWECASGNCELDPYQWCSTDCSRHCR